MIFSVHTFCIGTLISSATMEAQHYVGIFYASDKIRSLIIQQLSQNDWPFR